MVLGAVPTGAAPMGSVLPGTEALGTPPVVVPGCPGTVVAPGVPMVPPGTVVWAEATLLTLSPSRAAKNKEEVFIIERKNKLNNSSKTGKNCPIARKRIRSQRAVDYEF